MGLRGQCLCGKCQSFCSQGLCLVDTPWADTSWADTPWQTPSWADTPPGRHLLGQTPPGQTPPCPVHSWTPPSRQWLLQWAVRILLECFLVIDKFRLFTGLPNLSPTTREGNVFTGVCHSVQNWPYGYSVTAHPCYSMVGTHPTGMLSSYRPK